MDDNSHCIVLFCIPATELIVICTNATKKLIYRELLFMKIWPFLFFEHFLRSITFIGDGLLIITKRGFNLFHAFCLLAQFLRSVRFSVNLFIYLIFAFLRLFHYRVKFAITSEAKSRFSLISLCMTANVPTTKSQFKMAPSRLKRGKVKRNNSPLRVLSTGKSGFRISQ